MCDMMFLEYFIYRDRVNLFVPLKLKTKIIKFLGIQ